MPLRDLCVWSSAWERMPLFAVRHTTFCFTRRHCVFWTPQTLRARFTLRTLPNAPRLRLYYYSAAVNPATGLWTFPYAAPPSDYVITAFRWFWFKRYVHAFAFSRGLFSTFPFTSGSHGSHTRRFTFSLHTVGQRCCFLRTLRGSLRFARYAFAVPPSHSTASWLVGSYHLRVWFPAGRRAPPTGVGFYRLVAFWRSVWLAHPAARTTHTSG